MFVRALDGRRRHDLAAPLRGRTEYSVETDDVRARRRHERREAAKQLDRLQLQLLAAVGERALHSDREAPGPPASDKAATSPLVQRSGRLILCCVNPAVSICRNCS